MVCSHGRCIVCTTTSPDAGDSCRETCGETQHHRLAFVTIPYTIVVVSPLYHTTRIGGSID